MRDHPLAFKDVVAGGLFAVNVLPGFDAPDGGERVPVVRSGHRHRVDIFVFKKLPHVRIHLRFVPLKLFDAGCGAFGLRLVHIAYGRDVRILLAADHAQMSGAASAHSDNGYIDPIIRAKRTHCERAAGDNETTSFHNG